MLRPKLFRTMPTSPLAQMFWRWRLATVISTVNDHQLVTSLSHAQNMGLCLVIIDYWLDATIFGARGEDEPEVFIGSVFITRYS